MATAHSLPVVLPSVHPKAAPALPTAAELPQPTEHSRARARTSDTRLRLRSPSTPALLGRAPGGSASPRGTRRFPGDTALPGRGQGQPGSGGISAVTGERQRARAVPVSGESSLAARHGHGSPGRSSPAPAAPVGPAKGQRRSVKGRARLTQPGGGAEPPGEPREWRGWGWHSPGTRLGCTGLLRDRPEHGGTGRPAALGTSGREAKPRVSPV